MGEEKYLLCVVKSDFDGGKNEKRKGKKKREGKRRKRKKRKGEKAKERTGGRRRKWKDRKAGNLFYEIEINRKGKSEE